ncbi:MAG TPA: response regulator, partial [Nitriliruptorales bacterium]|nr:response regulator [Nitriliruptorales bacterium]
GQRGDHGAWRPGQNLGQGLQPVHTRHPQVQPDVVLLDLRMPRMDGLEALPQILTRSPRTMVAALSAMESELMGGAARARGAFAYIEKDALDAGLDERVWRLLQEFRRALAGDTVVAPNHE